MESSDFNTSKLTNDDIVYLENVMLDIRSYINVLHTTENKRRALLFPPINNFRRFLIHQLVENTFREEHLTTLSVGNLYARRTVVYPSSIKPMDDDKSSDAAFKKKSNIEKKLVGVQLYRPPSLRKQSTETPPRKIEKKTKKPDIQLYIPRGRRVFVPQEVIKENIRESKSCCLIDESINEPVKRASTDLSIVQKQERFSENELKADENDTKVRDTAVVESELIAEIPNKKLKDNDHLTAEHISTGTDNENIHILSDENSNGVNTNVIEKFGSIAVVSNVETRNSENNDVITFVDLTCDTDRNIPEQKENTSSGKMNRKSERNISTNTMYKYELTEDDIGFSINSTSKSKITEGDVRLLIDSSLEKQVTSQNDSLKVRKMEKEFVENLTVTHEITENDIGFLENVSTEKYKKYISDENDSLKARKMETCRIEDDENTKQTVILNCDEPRRNENITNAVHIERKLSARNLIKNASNEKNTSLNVNECDWEELFNEDGEYVDKSLLNELMTAVGKVTIQHASQDYTPFQTAEERTSDGGCIIEIYGFPSEFKTEDLLSAFTPYRNDSGFQIVWVDDTHALAIFSSPIIADEVLNTELPFIRTRPLKKAIPKSRMKARDHVLPPASRPTTCVSLARRLVSGHLGMKINVTDKQREVEKKLLSDAREKKRLVAKQKLETWEGNSSCGKYT